MIHARTQTTLFHCRQCAHIHLSVSSSVDVGFASRFTSAFSNKYAQLAISLIMASTILGLAKLGVPSENLICDLTP